MRRVSPERAANAGRNTPFDGFSRTNATSVAKFGDNSSSSMKPLPDLPSWVRQQLEDLTGLLKSDPVKVKSEFRRLNLQLTFLPTEAEPRAHYIVKGQCDLGALVFFYLRSRRQGAVLGPIREHPVHSRTPVLLRFSVRLPSVEARGRWRERGR